MTSSTPPGRTEHAFIGHSYTLAEHRDHRVRIAPATIGQGSQAQVYAGTLSAAENQLPVAVKVLRRGLENNRTVIARFKGEAELLTKLGGQGFPRCYGTGTTTTGQPFMVLSVAPGQTLKAIVEGGRRPLPDDVILEIARQAALALGRLSAFQAIHRDVKPSNLLWDGTVLTIIDLGASKANSNSHDRFGTLQYAAPEVLIANSPVTSRIDTYAIGTTMIYLATGQNPVAGTTDDAVMGNIVRGNLNSTQLAEPLRSIVRAMTHREPTQRLSLAQAVQRLESAAPEPSTYLGVIPTEALPTTETIIDPGGRIAIVPTARPRPTNPTEHTTYLLPKTSATPTRTRRLPTSYSPSQPPTSSLPTPEPISDYRQYLSDRPLIRTLREANDLGFFDALADIIEEHRHKALNRWRYRGTVHVSPVKVRNAILEWHGWTPQRGSGGFHAWATARTPEPQPVKTAPSDPVSSPNSDGRQAPAQKRTNGDHAHALHYFALAFSGLAVAVLLLGFLDIKTTLPFAPPTFPPLEALVRAWEAIPPVPIYASSIYRLSLPLAGVLASTGALLSLLPTSRGRRFYPLALALFTLAAIAIGVFT